MAFVSEVIPDNELYRVGFLEKYDKKPSQWAIDRERNMALVGLGMGGGPNAVYFPFGYIFLVQNDIVCFDSFKKSIMLGERLHDIKCTDGIIVMPVHCKGREDEIAAAIQEALPVLEGFGSDPDIRNVTLSIYTIKYYEDNLWMLNSIAIYPRDDDFPDGKPRMIYKSSFIKEIIHENELSRVAFLEEYHKSASQWIIDRERDMALVGIGVGGGADGKDYPHSFIFLVQKDIVCFDVFERNIMLGARLHDVDCTDGRVVIPAHCKGRTDEIVDAIRDALVLYQHTSDVRNVTVSITTVKYYEGNRWMDNTYALKYFI